MLFLLRFWQPWHRATAAAEFPLQTVLQELCVHAVESRHSCILLCLQVEVAAVVFRPCSASRISAASNGLVYMSQIDLARPYLVLVMCSWCLVPLLIILL